MNRTHQLTIWVSFATEEQASIQVPASFVCACAATRHWELITKFCSVPKWVVKVLQLWFWDSVDTCAFVYRLQRQPGVPQELVNMAAVGNPEVNLEMGNRPNSGEEAGRVEAQRVGERKMGDLEREIYLQGELYADEENDSSAIKRKKRMARTALTMWKEREEMFKHWILQWESEMRSIMNEVYNLVGLYSVFVGVVLTAIATSSRLGCSHLWSPVGLSLFAYSMLVVVAFKKFRDIRNLEERKEMYIEMAEETVTWVLRLREIGYADFDFDNHCPERRHRMYRAPFWSNALLLIVPLTIFTAGIVFSLVHILCWS